MTGLAETLRTLLISGGVGMLFGIGAGALVRTRRAAWIAAAVGVAIGVVLALIITTVGPSSSDSLVQAAVLAVLAVNVVGYLVGLGGLTLARHPPR